MVPVAYGIEDTKGLTGQQYVVAILVHVIVDGVLRRDGRARHLAPEDDPVRTDGFADDVTIPGGGVFDGAPGRSSRLDPGRRRSETS